MFFVILMVVSIMSGAEGPLFQVARLLGVLATLGETTSTAAGQAINVTGALASAATEVITSATSNGLNTAENVWRGVDVSRLEAARCAGILTVDGPEALGQWLNGTAAPIVIPCLTPELRDQLLAATTSVSLTLPSIQSAVESLELLSEFNATKVWAHLIADGRTQVHYEMVHLRFAVYWANPLWTNLELDLASEREQILRLLRLAVISLPSPTPSTGIRALDLEVQVSWPVLMSKVKMLTRNWLMTMSSVLDDTFRGGGTVSFFWWLGPLLVSFLLLLWPLLFHWRYFQSTTSGSIALLAVMDRNQLDDELAPPVSTSPDVLGISLSGSSSFAVLSDAKSEASSNHSFPFESGDGAAASDDF